MEKEECRKEADDNRLRLSDEWCKDCPYLYECRFMCMAMNEVVEGD